MVDNKHINKVLKLNLEYNSKSKSKRAEDKQWKHAWQPICAPNSHF